MNFLLLLSLYILILFLNITIISGQINEACPDDDFTFVATQNGKIPSEFAVSYVSHGVPGHYCITIAADKEGGYIPQVEGIPNSGRIMHKKAPYGKCTEEYFGNSLTKSVSAVTKSKKEKQKEEIKVTMNEGGCCVRAVNTKTQSTAAAKHPLLPPRIEATVPNLKDREKWDLGMVDIKIFFFI